MRRLDRWALGLVSSVVTVFIACCYGIPYAFRKAGRVVDSRSKQGIAGIQVTCPLPLHGEELTAVTWTDGQFGFRFTHDDEDCTELRFDDVDGGENGAYQSKTVADVEGDQEGLVVELDPVDP